MASVAWQDLRRRKEEGVLKSSIEGKASSDERPKNGCF